VRDAGGGLIVSPNVNPAVIAHTAQLGLVSLPGYATPTEAFAALEAGAHGLKLFPAEAASPRAQGPACGDPPQHSGVRRGRVTPQTLGDWMAAGAAGAGLGSALYKAGASVQDVEYAARDFMTEVHRLLD
jgi:2-dehydro-3-deoxyphosphogalactonate aldolase